MTSAAVEPARPPATGSAAPAEAGRPLRVGRPRHSLQTRILLWTAALVVLPTFVCGVWLNHIAQNVMSRGQRQTMAMATQALAASLSGRIQHGWNPRAKAVIDAMTDHPNLAMVIVDDARGRLLHRRVVDAQAWAAYQRAVRSGGLDKSGGADGSGVAAGAGPEDAAKPGRGGLPLGETQLFGPDRELVIERLAIPAAKAGAEPAGFVTLAMREPGLPALHASLRGAQLWAMVVVCVVMLPIVVVAVRRWTRPIRGMLAAVERLANEQRPDPVPVGSADELGVLAGAFNQMGQKLSDALDGLADYNQRLEAMVNARTAELEQANQRLETEVTDKNEFLRSVSHDLGAPLRNIDGMAKMLVMKYKADLADDALNKLDRISANAKLQSDLIADLLELSKLRTRPGRKEKVDLAGLVEGLMSSMSFDLKESGIKASIEGELPTILVEPTRIRQVFQNLLDNAAKYMLDSPTRLITVRADGDIEYYRFEVEDTGKGIAPEDRSKVFQVFQRAVHSGTHRVQGRGVGLASVRSIVESYGGQIWVESEPGEGSTFYFTLARRKVSLPVGA